MKVWEELGICMMSLEKKQFFGPLLGKKFFE